MTVLRLEHYQLWASSKEKKAGCFGPFTVPIEDMDGVKLPKEPWKFTESSDPLPKGCLADTELPEALLAARKRYPTAGGYALVSAAGIGYPLDWELETWLTDPGLYRPQLRGALVALQRCGDSRLKDTALRCAAVGDAHCSLKAEAFQVLAELKGDPDVEARRIIEKAVPVIDSAARKIVDGEAFPPPRNNLYDRFMSCAVNPVFYRLFVKADAFYAGDQCVSCGKCAELCPLNNITLKDGKPVWGENCTHCMACICRCPVEAIEYGKKSAGKPRYYCD